MGIALAAVWVGLTVLAPPASADPPAIPDSATLTWSIKLNALAATPGMEQTTPTTTTEFARHPLTAAVNTVEATLDATVPAGSRAAADVPGLRSRAPGRSGSTSPRIPSECYRKHPGWCVDLTAWNVARAWVEVGSGASPC